MQRIESCHLFGVGPAPLTRADLDDAVAEYQLAKWRRSRRTSSVRTARVRRQLPLGRRERRPLHPKLGEREFRGCGTVTYFGPQC